MRLGNEALQNLARQNLGVRYIVAPKGEHTTDLLRAKVRVVPELRHTLMQLSVNRSRGIY